MTETYEEFKKGVRESEQAVPESKQAENAMREREESFRQIYENLPVGLVRFSLDLRIQDVNKACCRMLGYRENELMGKHFRDITPHNAFEENGCKLSRLAAHEIDHYSMEKQFTHKSGCVVHGMLDANFVCATRGKPSYLLASVLDITERKRMEEALRKSEERLQLSLEINHASVFENNFETGTMIATPELFKFLGYGLDEVPKTIESMFALIHPEDSDRVMEITWDHFNGKIPYYYAEFRLRTKSGEWNWVDGTGKLVKTNAKGEPELLLGISRDFGERKKAQEDREKLIKELEDALENVKTLSGLLPICSKCKKIRDDKGYWNNLEAYIESHSDVLFSHGLCSECSDELYGDQEWYIKSKKRRSKNQD